MSVRSPYAVGQRVVLSTGASGVPIDAVVRRVRGEFAYAGRVDTPDRTEWRVSPNGTARRIDGGSVHSIRVWDPAEYTDWRARHDAMQQLGTVGVRFGFGNDVKVPTDLLQAWCVQLAERGLL